MTGRKLEPTKVWLAHQMAANQIGTRKPKYPYRAVQKKSAEKRLMAVLDEDTLRLLAGGTPCDR